jgi:hypothetical protein
LILAERECVVCCVGLSLLYFWFPSDSILTLAFLCFPFSELVQGRSRDCYESVGNRRLRLVCNSFLQQYLDAPGKLEKSRIVTQVMKIIRQNAPVGAFVTFENGRYYEVSERTAREKVGGFFRDSLPAEYRSSAKAKLARKKAQDEAGPPAAVNLTQPLLSTSSNTAAAHQLQFQSQSQLNANAHAHQPKSNPFLADSYAGLPLQFGTSMLQQQPTSAAQQRLQQLTASATTGGVAASAAANHRQQLFQSAANGAFQSLMGATSAAPLFHQHRQD